MTPIPPSDADAASPPPDPHVTALVLCDHVYEDPTTGKHMLLGTTTRFRIQHVAPSICPEIGLYVRATSMRGRYSFTVQLFSADQELPLGTPTFLDSIATTDPLEEFQTSANYRDIRVPAPGRYVVRLLANGRAIEAVVISLEATGGG